MQIGGNKRLAPLRAQDVNARTHTHTHTRAHNNKPQGSKGFAAAAEEDSEEEDEDDDGPPPLEGGQ